MNGTLTKLAIAGALTLSASAAAMANSVTFPGETAGLATGAPLPPGFYFVDTTTWGERTQPDGSKQAIGVTIPVLAWSTPWQILGGRLQFLFAAPAVDVGVTGDGPGRGYDADWFNPFLAGQLAWDLGGGFGFRYSLGAYIGLDDSNPVADHASSLNQQFALSYTGNGWNLTANLIYGTQLENIVGNPYKDFINLDLTATKTFGKWEVGAVGLYSTDVGKLDGDPKRSQFALGGLVGYDFGPLKTQVYVTHTLTEDNYGGDDTRVFGRVIVPLGDPLGSSSAPSKVLYRK